mmetsp:Transcript_100869/g.325599  ORF Transcript_100869/g.325599 Transcript_100869/m.325599 type:complete len:203 (+) Transcript_100869:486-1094(+)
MRCGGLVPGVCLRLARLACVLEQLQHPEGHPGLGAELRVVGAAVPTPTTGRVALAAPRGPVAAAAASRAAGVACGRRPLRLALGRDPLRRVPPALLPGRRPAASRRALLPPDRGRLASVPRARSLQGPRPRPLPGLLASPLISCTLPPRRRRHAPLAVVLVLYELLQLLHGLAPHDVLHVLHLHLLKEAEQGLSSLLFFFFP